MPSRLPVPVTAWLCIACLATLLQLQALPVLAQQDLEDFLNEFAIRLKDGGRIEADSIAKQYGFRVKRELKDINVFLLEHPNVHHRSKRSAVNELSLLARDSRIEHAQQEVSLTRVKRKVVYDKQLELPIRAIADDSLFARFTLSSIQQRDNIFDKLLSYADPKFHDMWYLDNRGQSGGEVGLDMNVGVAWENGITGKGVVVCILDDGIDHRHPDLIVNYDPLASTDLNDQTDVMGDPMPNLLNIDNSHGTRCAGEVAAAANNGVCGVGVAYDAKIGGVRILDGKVTDGLEAAALQFNSQYIDIYSSSWGPSDNGITMEGPRHFALQALITGVAKGRKGRGSIFVWATGNGGMNGDDCSADGYVSRPETLSVGSVNDWGRSPFFMENCSSTLAVVPSGGEEYLGQERHKGIIKLKVVTTDMNGGCIENFQGTSSAAPLAAGCIANVLQANPDLTWRDVQHIVVRGSRIPSADKSWIINGAGHHVSHRFGFGLMDCGKMVQIAQTWNLMPERQMCNKTKENYQLLMWRGSIEDTIVVDKCGNSETQTIDRLEHVQVHVKMTSDFRGENVIILTSPAGTRSKLLSARQNDNNKGEWEFTFMTVHNWDEKPYGKWKLEVHHQPAQERAQHWHDELKKIKDIQQKYTYLKQVWKEHKSSVGYIKQWSLALFGTHGTRYDRMSTNAEQNQQAYYPSVQDVLNIKKREVAMSHQVKVKRQQEKRNYNDDAKQTLGQSKDVLHEIRDLLQGQTSLKKRVFKQDSNAAKRQSARLKKNLKNLSVSELIDEISDEIDKRLAKVSME